MLDFLAQQVAGNKLLDLPVVTLTEFTGGVRPSDETRTERLLALFILLEVDQAIARLAGDYLRQFRRSQRIDLAMR